MMNQTMGQRYIPDSRILSFENGALHSGKDLFLNRRVLLYSRECPEGQSGEDYIVGFSNRASFKHDGFHYILDTSFEGRSVLIVLQFKPGKLFLDEFSKKIWTFSQGIQLVSQLGVSMLDAMEQQITGFSVAPQNLWIGNDGRISVINYWDEGEAQTQGAIGLCSLLIQIFSGATKIPGAFEALHMHLERIHIPSAEPEQKAALVKLVNLVCQGQASLSTFVFGLRSLTLKSESDEDHSQIYSPAQADFSAGLPGSKRRAAAEDSDQIELGDTELVDKPNRLYKWVGAGVFSLVFIVFLIWLLSFSPNPKEDVSVLPSDTGRPTQDSRPTQSPEPQQVQPTAAPDQNQDVTIPNLANLTQADAEKQALSAGLHYNYILEANPQAQGTVFKQDPQPGTKAAKGDNVTFWIGK